MKNQKSISDECIRCEENMAGQQVMDFLNACRSCKIKQTQRVVKMGRRGRPYAKEDTDLSGVDI